MRLHALLLASMTLVCLAAMPGPAQAESEESTVADLQQQVAEMSARMAELQAEVSSLRTRVENELANETAKQRNIKTGRGGIVDIEATTVG